jgi:hypothetical protein
VLYAHNNACSALYNFTHNKCSSSSSGGGGGGSGKALEPQKCDTKWRGGSSAKNCGEGLEKMLGVHNGKEAVR